MKKVLSTLIIVALLLSMLSAIIIPASAATSGTTGDCTWSLDGTELTISGNGPMGNYNSDYHDLPWGDDITSVVIENGVTSIGDSAFSWCAGLTSVTIGDDVTFIGDYAFFCCMSLPSVTIPDSVTSIGDRAFNTCKSLPSVTIPDSVTFIGDSAFVGCNGLTSITIPDSVTTIGDGAFSLCDDLNSIVVDADNANYCSENGVLFSKDKSNLICFPAGKCGAYMIPDSVASIGDHAFDSCDGLTSITIPNSVTSIGDVTFAYCYGLTSVTIPDSVTSIGDSAFEGCDSLTSITIPDSVTSIGDSAFAYCYSLPSVTIPDSVTTIGDSVFSSCGGLTSVTIPDSVTSIGHGAFAWCCGLTTVTIPDSVTSIGNGAFEVCYGLTSVIIPDGVTAIGDYVFADCDGLRDVWYTGSADDRKGIAIGEYNEPLIDATWHYNTCAADSHAYSSNYDSSCENCEWVRNLTIKNPFIDIKESDFYYAPVLWAVENNITSGISLTTFAPNDACTRGQIVSFLWRAAGSPAPKGSNNPFKDVGSDQYYYQAVLWAVENGITSGTSDTTFSPYDACTRGQIVSFLCRAAGSPAPKGSNNPFKDVGSNQYYYKAVLWAVENGITAGTSATTFSPNDACTRGQIVTFLFRSKN